MVAVGFVPTPAAVIPAHGASLRVFTPVFDGLRTRVNTLVLGIHIPELVVMGPRFRGDNSLLDTWTSGGAMKKSFVRGTWQVKRAFSPAVIAEGAGRTIFIAGHTGQTDDAGKSLAGDFDAQFKQTFRNIERTLAEAGAKLSDMVTMTVFLIDARYTTRMTELRTELFGKDFPASAAITVQGFAQAEMMIEVQGIAVTA
jgi:2-iminobutanoate/2-iminopropanoate deaminase